VLAGRIIQFRAPRPKATFEITDSDHASLLLGHTKSGITERVYPRWGTREAHRIGKVSEALAK